jgi:uncharacterized membrane protein
VAFDANSMRAVVFTINGQGVTHWLSLAWTTAILCHLVAWMTPRPNRWPVVDQWFNDASASKRTVSGRLILSYQSSPKQEDPGSTRLDALGIFLSFCGSILFLATSASRWSGTMLTLLAIVWLVPILLLAVPGRRLAYSVHAALLIGLITLHWLVADNLQPLLYAWNDPLRDQTPPILNLSVLCIVLLCGGVLWLTRIRRLTDFNLPEAFAAIAMMLFAALTFESWRIVDYAATHGPAIEDVAQVKQMAMSVLWSLIGFAAVLLGFWKHIRPLRIAALALLGITVAKIFLIDMKNVEAVWRILSFIALGSLLLGVSYLYHQHQEQSKALE